MEKEYLIEIRDWLLNQVADLLKLYQSLSESEMSIKNKGPQDFVTNVDYSIEAYIKNRIMSKFPDHGVLSEETIVSSELLNGIKWVIDPLDGTMNFINGIPFFCVSIVMIIDGRPSLALIVDLVNGDIFDAADGCGARQNKNTIIRHKTNKTSDFVAVSTGFLDLLCKNAPHTFSRLRKLGKIRVLGAQALQLCYIASGRLLANLSVEAKLWDDVAGALIVTESNCLYKSLAGIDIFNLKVLNPKQNLFSVASPPQIHQELLEIFNALKSN